MHNPIEQRGWKMNQLLQELNTCNKVGTHFTLINDALSRLYTRLAYYFKNVMFGFKLIFSQTKQKSVDNDHNDKQDNPVLNIIKQQLVQMAQTGSIFKETDNKIVCGDLNMMQCQDKSDSDNVIDTLIMSLIFKIKGNDMSHMEPKWTNQCQYCQYRQWGQTRL